MSAQSSSLPVEVFPYTFLGSIENMEAMESQVGTGGAESDLNVQGPEGLQLDGWSCVHCQWAESGWNKLNKPI